MGRVYAAAARLFSYCAAGGILVSCAGTPPPPPPAPPPRAETAWPTHGWQTSTPEAQGVDSAWLAYAIQTIQWKHLPVHSLLIERHGSIVLDAYFHPFADNELHDVASVTKSVLSTLVGIAQAKQQMSDLNTPVWPILAQEQSADSRKARLSLAHLLSMTSGLDCSERDGQNFLQQMVSSPHWTSFALERNEIAEPGTSFNYCAVNMQLVSAVLTRKTGESAAEFAQRELFAPLGIRSFYWPTDGDGISHGYADLRLQPRDMAKLGYLWLHHGVWEDKQLVSASYLDAAVSPHAQVSASVKYGYGLWVYPYGRAGCPAHFEANGNGGQRIAVIPSKDIVMVITGSGLNADEVASLIAPAWKSDRPLLPNPRGIAKLSAAIARAAAAPDILMASTSTAALTSSSPAARVRTSPAEAAHANAGATPVEARPSAAAPPSLPLAHVTWATTATMTAASAGVATSTIAAPAAAMTAGSGASTATPGPAPSVSETAPDSTETTPAHPGPAPFVTSPAPAATTASNAPDTADPSPAAAHS